MSEQGANTTIVVDWPDLNVARQGDSRPPAALTGLEKIRQQWQHRLKWALFRQRLKIEDRLSRAYDAAHNVETAGEAHLADCGVPAEDIDRGNGLYRVTWGWLIRKSLRQLRIDHSRYTFIDYGAGKGKAMLMASDYPFKRIIGVEYSEKLHAIAAANCASYRSATQKCQALEPIRMDVLNYEPPSGPVVIFMCNPFDDATMQAVFGRWRACYGGRGKDIRIMYLNMRTISEKSYVLDQQDWLSPVAKGKRYVILGPRSAV